MTDAKGRAHTKALEAALISIAYHGADAIMFSEGRIGIAIDREYNVAELASYMDVRRVGNTHLLCDEEVITAVLLTGATAYAFVRATTEIDNESASANEPVSEGSEGDHILPVPEPTNRRIQLVGSGHGEGMPGGSDSEYATAAYERR